MNTAQHTFSFNTDSVVEQRRLASMLESIEPSAPLCVALVAGRVEHADHLRAADLNTSTALLAPLTVTSKAQLLAGASGPLRAARGPDGRLWQLSAELTPSSIASHLDACRSRSLAHKVEVEMAAEHIGAIINECLRIPNEPYVTPSAAPVDIPAAAKPVADALVPTDLELVGKNKAQKAAKKAKKKAKKQAKKMKKQAKKLKKKTKKQAKKAKKKAKKQMKKAKKAGKKQKKKQKKADKKKSRKDKKKKDKKKKDKKKKRRNSRSGGSDSGGGGFGGGGGPSGGGGGGGFGDVGGGGGGGSNQGGGGGGTGMSQDPNMNNGGFPPPMQQGGGGGGAFPTAPVTPVFVPGPVVVPAPIPVPPAWPTQPAPLPPNGNTNRIVVNVGGGNGQSTPGQPTPGQPTPGQPTPGQPTATGAPKQPSSAPNATVPSIDDNSEAVDAALEARAKAGDMDDDRSELSMPDSSDDSGDDDSSSSDSGDDSSSSSSSSSSLGKTPATRPSKAEVESDSESDSSASDSSSSSSSSDSDSDNEALAQESRERRALNAPPVKPAEALARLSEHWERTGLGKMPAAVSERLAACGGQYVSPELCVARIGSAYSYEYAQARLAKNGRLYERGNI